MDQISKELAKLSLKERAMVKKMLVILRQENTTGLDIKKLKGHSDVFRLRVGSVRMIYRRTSTGIKLLTLGRRNDHTYKEF